MNPDPDGYSAKNVGYGSNKYGSETLCKVSRKKKIHCELLTHMQKHKAE
jgi:hypothetical protein